ncbi:MAG TPA: beta-propeller domain-containing protein, methanol dehydrogenase [Cyanobacteria bacterium UBA12227]|nr:beta-propeller domain-containing protein, methanol dehydrogenase [Cyanobacteria bacterium UBA12227]HAX89579.1 beta-propeller domain-containing protein, methanol dehydrogenase [Cyanobacteria bacterium UBA11370]
MSQLFNKLYKAQKYLQQLMLSVLLMAIASGLVAAPANATGVYEMPTVSAGEATWVIDTSDVLSRVSEGKLSNRLAELAQKTGNEVRMLTFRRLDYGETIQTFAKALFEKWYPTPEAQANQTLVVIDTQTNNTAVVTGEGIKSMLSDDIAQSIASETMVAPLREGDKYNQAFLDGSDRIIALLSGEPDPGPPTMEQNIQVESTFTSAEETDTKNSTIWVVVLLVVATVVPMATYFLYVK